MGIRWRDFEIPKKLVKEKVTPTYGKFIAEPLERGFGTTFGNSLRRIILSSIEGTAVVGVKINGVEHEFSHMKDVVEDVTKIILNIKSLILKMDGREKKTLTINVNKKGDITAADIKTDGTVTILNPELHIATLSEKRQFSAELIVAKGRGYVPAERNKEEKGPIGLIYLDTAFSPVERVNSSVENTRVGQMTDYDKLTLEIWTNGGVSPEEAIAYGAAIWKKHLDIFDPVLVEEEKEVEISGVDELESKLNKDISELELSVRSANCLKEANINTIKELVTKSEAEMLKYRNFGKRSLTEISEILGKMGLSFDMKLDSASNKKQKKDE